MKPSQPTDYHGLNVPGVQFSEAPEGLARFEIETALARGAVVVQGAHVLDWTPIGAEPVLFVSSQSFFAPGKAIRGGVPVCFPWFAARAGHPDSPAHGFGRTVVWNVESVSVDADGSALLEFSISDNESTRAHWRHSFEARYRVKLGRTLEMSLAVTNTGAEPFTFEAALHTYFKVADIRVVSITGLENTEYIDKVKGGTRRHHGTEPLRFTEETDRVFVNTTSKCVLHDPGLARRITVAKSGSSTTVVWNPWEAKAAALADFGSSEWPGMACIETANAGQNAITLGLGESHAMTAEISVG